MTRKARGRGARIVGLLCVYRDKNRFQSCFDWRARARPLPFMGDSSGIASTPGTNDSNGARHFVGLARAPYQNGGLHVMVPALRIVTGYGCGARGTQGGAPR